MISVLSPCAKIKSPRCAALLSISALVACVDSSDIGPNAPDRGLEQQAAQKIECGFENQDRCAHMIENRTLLTRFFAPKTLGGMPEDEKIKGRRVTTKFIVDAAVAIQQCRRVEGKTVTILKDVRIAQRGYILKGTSPLSPTSTCFLTPDPENP